MMQMRDIKSCPGPGYRVFTRANRKRRKDYGSENPTRFENTVLTAAVIMIVGVCILAAILAFPDFCELAVDQGRELVAISKGVAE